jgi:hypothetical protein
VPFARELLEALDEVEQARAAPGRDARAQLARRVFDGKQITARYAARIRSVEPPDSDAGIQAKKWVDFSAAEALERVRRAERHVRRLPEDISLVQSSRSLELLQLTFVNVILVDMKGVPWSIRQFVPELRAAFADADSCKELEAIGKAE